MNTESFHLVVSEATRGRVPRKNILEEYDFESDNIFKDIAQIIGESDVYGYPQGLYFELSNQHGDMEKFWANNRGDSMFVRYCTDRYGGFDSSYTDWDVKPKYLTCLDEESNEYKYYLMTLDEASKKLNVQYGRIGMQAGEFHYQDGNYSKDGTYEFEAPMFWVKYYEKIAKGYEDQTELKDFERTEKKATLDDVEYAPIEEDTTRQIMDFLISQQRELVQRSFDLSVPFSQKAIEISQDLLTQMHRVAASDSFDKEQQFTNLYKKLVTTLPRKIYDVSDYIHRVDFKDKSSDNFVANILENEQELLDNFIDLYGMEEALKIETPSSKETVLQANGLQAAVADFKDKFDALFRAGDDAHKISNIISVQNERTARAYEATKQHMRIQDKDCYLMWHGSRNENWWSIYKNGMSLNPNAIITGKMFGQGLYFAPKFHKAEGYTNMNGYWTGLHQKKGYLALFEVAMGRSYEPTHALGSSFTGKDLAHGCSSVWAYPSKTGLYNEECIVYNAGQCNMVALVEIDSSRNIPFHMDLKKAVSLKISSPTYETDAQGHGHIVAEAPNFSKKCPSLISTATDVVFDYDTDTKRLSVKTSSFEALLSDAERDFLADVFMSKFCENEREFALIASECKARGDIPQDIKKQFQPKRTSRSKKKEADENEIKLA